MISLSLLLAMGALSLGAITFAAGDVRTRMRQGLVGAWAERGFTERYFTGFNASPQAVNVQSFVVTDPGDSTDVTVTIAGVAVTYNTSTGLDASQIATNLVAAINAEPLVRGQVVASNVGATVTLTGLTMGTDFTLAATTPASIGTLTVVTASADAAAIPFGRLVVWTGFNTGESEKLVGLPNASSFTAQVITATASFVSGAVLTATVYEVRGAERTQIAAASETSATNLATTLTALMASLNADLAASTVVATGGTTNIVFTSEVPGTEFDVELIAGDEGASVPTTSVVYTTGPGATTSLLRGIAGISLYSPIDGAPVGSDTGEYAGNAGVLVAEEGKIWVACDESPVYGGTVYVETAAGATSGRLYAAASATRIALPRSKVVWERDGLSTTDGLAVVRVNL